MLVRAQDPKLLTPQILRCCCCSTWEFQGETGRERQQQTVVAMLLHSMTAAFFHTRTKLQKQTQKKKKQREREKKEKKREEDRTKLIHVNLFFRRGKKKSAVRQAPTFKP
jgi:hypothetical protein